jgi:histidinol dehydrogenase
MIPLYSGDAVAARLKETWQTEPDAGLYQRVNVIIAEVAAGGDAALAALAQRFGDSPPKRLSDADVAAAVGRVCPEIKAALLAAADNIRQFAQSTLAQAAAPFTLHLPGRQVGLRWQPVARVACYVPGGRYPLPSSALMTAITAQVAGVPDICIVSPNIHDAVVFAGTLAGVREFWPLGGAQAVAAAAYGTAGFAAADMLVGPGNAYVTEAKRQLQGRLGIDMLAGPSEVVILADASAQPDWIALDLLAQAEHDPDARVYLLTDSPALALAVQNAVTRGVQCGRYAAFLPEALAQSGLFVLPTLEAAVAVANAIAPEHLALHVEDTDLFQPMLQHYGALFVGAGAPVPVGDYAAGPNHTLPTARSARFSGGLTPMTFLRPQTWQHLDRNHPDSQQLYEITETLATLEGLCAHADAARARRLPASSSATLS